MTNIYLDAIHRALPRLLASYNLDTTSDCYGVGDRNYWAWKLTDFANGTHQAAVHALALMVVEEKLPAHLSKESAIDLIDGIFQGIGSIRSSTGGLDEALPNEGSFCVTALVLSDACAAVMLLEQAVEEEKTGKWVRQLAPLAEFLAKQDESHGLISNHLATAALAAHRWRKLTGDNKLVLRGDMWLGRILDNQSSEGWFSEYGGADPGYQSWCTTQLAQLHILHPDLGLRSRLESSLEFLVYAAHPDGTFGGKYGSRNTRFLLPGGIEILKAELSIANTLADFARRSIESKTCVTIDCIDSGNLVPFLNDYALAASHHTPDLEVESSLPYQNECDRWFADAGWLVSAKSDSYSIVNFRRGGCAKLFEKGELVMDDPGVLISDSSDTLFANYFDPISMPEISIDCDSVELSYQVSLVKRPMPGPFQFIVLRLMSLTAFRSLALGNCVKRFLAWYLLATPRNKGPIVQRLFQLKPKLQISDKFPSGYKKVTAAQFNGFHMASQGYWQKGDWVRKS